jgi:hypothetical protein
MHRVGRRTETVSKKKSDFFLMGECFFLTYFLIGASGGFIRRLCGGLARRLYGGVADWPEFFGEEVIVARIKI